MSLTKYSNRIIPLLDPLVRVSRVSSHRNRGELPRALERLFWTFMPAAADSDHRSITAAAWFRAVRNSLLCFLSLCLFGQPRSSWAQLPDNPTPKTSGELPFTFSSGFLIIVEGQIGSLKKLKFILDTGTTRSIVDRRVAEKLRLPLYPRRMFDVDKFFDVSWAVFPEVAFGPVSAANVSLSVADLALFSTLVRHVDAVIGADLLSRNSFTIDYDRKKVLFRSAERAAPDDPGKLDPPLLTVEIQVQGQSVHLLVDTGFPEVLLFEDRVLKHITRLKSEHATREFSVAGRLRVRRVSLPSVRLGTTEASLRVLLAKGPPDSILPGVDGLLGTAVLKARRININIATQTLDWEN
jgi:predicted aspartyl protease